MKSENWKCTFNIFTDSQNSIDCICNLIGSHENRKVIRKCQAIICEIQDNGSKVVMHKVKAHSGDEYNDMADKLASQGSLLE